jgi:sarcosine oxidase subunit alpha
MTGPQRLANGGLIDRTKTIRFSFDGNALQGFGGDTLASALMANGVRLVGRSFKYHRPRGIFSAGPEEPNALVELRSGARCEPNTKATTVELFDGLEAASQNRWPSLAFDVHAINQLAGPLLVAGFYYKTFMWPAAFWEKIY